MTGITAFGAYIPFYRLAHKEIVRAWGGRAGEGERAVAGVDEDSITMAVEAVRDLLAKRDVREIDGLMFATTTSPFAEKQASALIATAADLRDDIRAADYTSSLRSATIATLTAIDSVKAGSASNVIIAAADTRLAVPKSSAERIFGDAASAIEVGATGVIAELIASHSTVDEMTDVWRNDDARFVSGWEERFAVTQGYQRVVRQTANELFERSAIGPSEISKAILSAPDPGTLAATAKGLGLKAEQVPDHLHTTLGNTGSAMPLLVLSSVLEEARAGEKLLVVGYGSGCDALMFEVTDELEKVRSIVGRRGVKGHLASKAQMRSYEDYARFRELIPTEAARRQAPSASAPLIWRRRDDIYRFHGYRCLNCGKVQYPHQRVCISCQSLDGFESVRLADKPAKLFTFTLDYLNADPDPPTVMTIVDFEGGGRAYLQMTDRNPADVKIDQPVEMTFRRLYEAEGFTNYYWKCRPVR
ncbi:MAG TPA: 3-oxoacyl-[acyl-carrier-protein] synthase III C-terminal domain-containing protein [Blastocatellia bacterium]|nr:3-oxoacyl-[acyl-carrier-protein] synthase III C-terminal domain-containing protein [Blastocatellia bacterium]